MTVSFESLQQLKEWQPPQVDSIISDGILLPGSRLVLFGSAKRWKSMLALHTAFALAEGKPWFGFDTSKCLTAILQLEIPKAAYRIRVMKYAKGAGIFTASNIYFKTEYYLKLDSSYGTNLLTRELSVIKERHPGLHLVVIIDPLYKVISGHINDPSDMGKLVDNLDSFRQKTECSLIIIHHEGKAIITPEGKYDREAEAMLGSSVLNNWCDTAVGIRLLNPHTGGDRVMLKFELVRLAETLLPQIEVQWHRGNLRPELIDKRFAEDFSEENISIRGGIE